MANPYPKPRPFVFMLVGYELADTLAILDRWDSMTAEEVRALNLERAAPDETNVIRPPFASQ